ncbi:MAG: transcriptional regulator [Nitrospinae bacterium RIFCSPLOWO2_12_FULL_45_22]|nr:MAG: transcriptional regulator [Nitrospinae bacterium RIFCSPLOWO2_12_FULL_45_22]
MLDDRDKAIIQWLQGDLPLKEAPYKEIADALAMTEEEVLGRIASFLARGYLRRIGAVLYHQEAGFKANAMGVWQVPPDQVERVGMIMSSFTEVSHCYERPTTPQWPYNLFTMIHGRDKEQCQKVAEAISHKTGIKEYRLLFSIRELKKTSMSYF